MKSMTQPRGQTDIQKLSSLGIETKSQVFQLLLKPDKKKQLVTTTSECICCTEFIGIMTQGAEKRGLSAE